MMRATVSKGAHALAGPLIGHVLREVLHITLPIEKVAGWLKDHFEDHSRALPAAIAAANNRAWQAFELALTGESFWGRLGAFFQDGDLKAFKEQIRSFLAMAEDQFQGQPEGLRVKACKELHRLKKEGRLELVAEVVAKLDLNRFASAAATTETAQNALEAMAREIAADCPHLARVLQMVPPQGGPPLLASAFAFFLRREIATKPELAREVTFDQLRLVTGAQIAGFENLSGSIERLDQAQNVQWDQLWVKVDDWFTSTDEALQEIGSQLQKILENHRVSTKAESPLRVSVTSERERALLLALRERLRNLPPKMIDAQVFEMLGDGLSAAGHFADAETAQNQAVRVAQESGDRKTEAEAAFKEYKAACETKHWDQALGALHRAIALDEKRFRPVPKHYRIEGILGAGAFGVVLKCRNSISFDEDGNDLVCAVKTFRESDLDRPLKEVFAEAHAIKHLNHPNVVRVLDHGYADSENQERPYLAMEFLDGLTLEDYLQKQGRLSPTVIHSVFGRIAAALHAAHSCRRPIIHRDIKPANVFLVKKGEHWGVKVIDFGLAVKSSMRLASLSLPHDLRATRDQSVTGTIKYAAPEQLGEKPYPVGPHSDVYAFGKTALEALVGTVQPTPRHWKQIPEAMADLLARCVEEEFFDSDPHQGRFHSFGPILEQWKSPQATTVNPSPVPVTPTHSPEVKTRTASAAAPQPPTQVFPTRATPSPVPATSTLPIEVPTPAYPTVSPSPTPNPKPMPTGLGARDRHEITLPGGVTMAFSWCPAGSFLMGSPETENYRESIETHHRVTLTQGFWLGIHPVTQAQWKAVMKSNPSRFQGDDLPVESLSWIDCLEFCKALKKESGISLRLPTEAEWEYAARAGSQMPFYWGDHLNGTEANCDGNHPYGTTKKGPFLMKTTPVGSYAKIYQHPWWLTDLIGNVWEWCSDWYDADYYNYSPIKDPQGPENGSVRVIRGGSWFNVAGACRLAFRNGYIPGNRCHSLGFRLAADPSGGPLFEHWKSSSPNKPTPSLVTVTSTPPPDVPTQTVPKVVPSSTPKANPKPNSLRAGYRHEITLPGGGKMAFAWCPPGSFLMGSPESERDRGSDETQHLVILTQGFWLGIHPVTVKDFAELVKATHFQTDAETIGGAYRWNGSEWKWDPKTNWRNPGFDQSLDHPVTCVSWNDTQRFLEWVREVTEFPVGLPTEAQWEYAARSGTQTPFYWGDQLNGTQANCDGKYPYGTAKKGPNLGKTTSVGHYAKKFPHPWGLTDVIGNVWEWCADRYAENYYINSPNQDPQGPESGSSRVFRGGSWRSFTGACRVASRNGDPPGYRINDLGFRLVAGPTELHG